MLQHKAVHPSYLVLLDAWDFSKPYAQVSTIISLIITTLMMTITTFAEVQLGITTGMLFMVVLVIVGDLVTGILAAKRKGQKITSAKGVRSGIKLMAYLLFLYSVNMLLKGNDFPGAKLVFQMLHYYITIHIFFWESFSIDENLEVLGINLGLSKIFKGIFKKFNTEVGKQGEEPKEQDKE